MTVRVTGCRLFGLTLDTRMPFRFGIATMTRAPQVFVRVTVETEQGVQDGVAADLLPPKWFTKDPSTSYRSDLTDMLTVIDKAAEHALAVGAAPSVFELWHRICQAQRAWAADIGYPPLLWGFGVSLVERAVIDAHCRASRTTFAAAVRANTLGIELGRVHQRLDGLEPAQLLPRLPAAVIAVRHTVGLSDPITDDEIEPPERLADGLPQSLQACIQHYSPTYFKIKLSGRTDADLARLHSISGVLPSGALCTFDGNEQFRHVDEFADFWKAFDADPGLATLKSRVLFVEQPLHRDHALHPEVHDALARWSAAPPLVIDESGADPASVSRALELGYAGASHKNCKGVFHGIASACLVAHLNRTQSGRRLLLTGEDLTNVGPVALHQDLAVMAPLGLTHVERNGHHYFAGASAYPATAQDHLLKQHDDMYVRHPDGFPMLRLDVGQLSLDSVNKAPFGTEYLPNPAELTAVDDWDLTQFD